MSTGCPLKTGALSHTAWMVWSLIHLTDVLLQTYSGYFRTGKESARLAVR